MLAEEHAQMSQMLLWRSQDEFAGGNPMVASEMLWGAVAHALLAHATQRGWRKNSHRAIKDTARQLSKERSDARLLTYVDSAEKLHENFYHNNLNPGRIAQRREQAAKVVPYLLSLLR